MNDLQSTLAQPIADFLQYQQALNKKYQTETLALRLFDRYLFEQGITGWQAITSSVIDAFMASRSRHRPRSYNHLLGVLRRFFDWAVLLRWINQNPVVQRSKRETGKRLPYLFDLTMARRLLAVGQVAYLTHRRGPSVLWCTKPCLLCCTVWVYESAK